jgi:hypothetical protein
MKNRPRPRRMRPLLLAGAALTMSLASTGCPFGNLKAPNCDASPDSCGESPDMAVPDLSPPPADMKPRGD